MNRLLLSLCCLSIPWTVRGGIADEWVLDSSPQVVPFDTTTTIITAYDSPIPKQSTETTVRSIMLPTQLPASTTGNPIKAVRYWFDSHRSVEQELPNTNGATQIDVSGLSAGIHSLYVQAEDTAGICSDITAHIFYRIPGEAANTAVQNIYYWYDDDEKIHNKLDATGGTAQIDASALTAGLHTIYVQAEDAAGLRTDVTTRVFYKIPDQQQSAIKAVNYWFDDDLTINKQLPTTDGVALIDVSALTAGLHTIYVQAEDATGLRTDVTPRVFYKIPTEVDRTLSWAYWFDEEEEITNVSAIPGATILLDVTNLSDGLHFFHSYVSESNTASDVYTRMFFKTPQIENAGDLTCLCSIDDKLVAKTKATPNGGIIHWDMDLNSLEAGIHRARIQVLTADGTSSPVAERYFARIGQGIIQYDYWLNEDGPVHSTKFEKEKSPFSLISLLPVETMPLRSKCFHFEVKNDQPAIYAKNDIHFRFNDAAGRYKEISKQFVDYKVSETIELLTPLTSGQREWKNVPEENKIHWFTAQALRGDSLAVKTTQAATLQIFSPTGTEVYAASGMESVNYGGLHAEEDGTYYVALHDVKGTSSPTIGLDYEHIDKYAVLKQDVTKVGNGGASTITFEGNGFDELESVELRKGDVTIPCDSIGHEGKAITSLTFDFDGVEQGQYNAVFHFTEEDITVENSIKVEEPKPFEFNAVALYEPFFDNAAGCKFVFKIHNNSNMTAYNVPLAFQIMVNSPYRLGRIEIGGYNIKNDIIQLFDESDHSSIDSLIELKRQESGDMYAFFRSKLEQGDKYYNSKLPYLYTTGIMPSLRPNTTETFTIYVKSKVPIAHQYLSIYMLYPQDLENDELIVSVREKTQISKMTRNRRRTRSNAEIECIACNNRARLGDNVDFLENKYSNRLNCTGCPDFDGDDSYNRTGGTVEELVGGDPNDIIGYISESGSTFVKEGLQDLHYTIEFENDPEIATGSAHEIVVTDTLDVTKFDLNSYVPTRLKIGLREVELDGTPNFVTTIDMRPEINAIAQVEGNYDKTKGAIRYTFSSLDPMTMEKTDHVMQGILPVNDEQGSGIGEVSYNIRLKKAYSDGTAISNQATIVFDTNDAINTPVWTNVVDAVAPTSRVASGIVKNDSIVTLRIQSSDARSGVWKYDVYAQLNSDGAWEKVVENAADTLIDVRFYEGIDQGFYVCATDSAGNVEQKEAAREWTLNKVYLGDANGDGRVNSEDVLLAVGKYLGRNVYLNIDAADVNHDGNINSEDVVGIVRIYLEEQIRRNIPIKRPLKRRKR